MAYSSTPVLFAFVIAFAGQTFSRAAITRPIALSGSQAPGAPSGAAYSSFGVPVLNNSRQIAFTATLDGAGVTPNDNIGIWSGRNAYSLVTRSGDVLPNSSRSYVSFDSVHLNNSGKIAFRAQRNSAYWFDEAILTNRNGFLEVVASSGDAPPGATDGALIKRFADESTLAFNSSGDIAFTAYTAPPHFYDTESTGVWADRQGDLSLVARYFGPAADLDRPSHGRTYYSSPRLATLSDRGDVAFSSSLSGSYFYGLFVERGGVVKTLAAINYASYSLPGQLSVDELGYSTYTRTRSYSPYEYFDIVNERDPSNEIVSSESSLPGYSFVSSAYFGSAAEKIIAFNQYSDAANLGFVATLAHVNTRGPNLDVIITPWNEFKQRVYSEFGGQMSLVATTGDAAPETNDGALFHRFEAGFNHDARTVFLATLSGPSIHTGNDRGLWVQNDAGDMVLVARTGDALEVGPGDLRYISSLAYAGGSSYASGHSGGFNDDGDLLFRATFTDGSSGLFLYGAVPEPQTACMAIVAGLLVASNMRSHRKD